jgi:hypothetical protein
MTNGFGSLATPRALSVSTEALLDFFFFFSSFFCVIVINLFLPLKEDLEKDFNLSTN